MQKPSELWKQLDVSRTVFALSIARMADGIGNSILFILIPLYLVKLHTTVNFPMPILVGILISAYGLGTAAFQPFTAAITDRLGIYRRAIQAGLILIAIATVAFAFATSFLDLLVLRIVQGLGLAMEIPATMAALAIVTKRETRGGSMGFYTTLRMLGLAIGPLLGGALHDYVGFDATFFIGAGILVLAAFVVQFGVEPVNPPKATKKKDSKSGITSVMSPGILNAAIATFLMATAFTLVTTLENEFNHRLHTGAFGFSIAFSALMVGRLLTQVPLGHLSDRIGRKPFVLLGLIVMAPATGYLGEVGSLWSFTGVRFLQGIASAAIVAPALAYAGDLAQEGGQEGHQSRQMSIVTMGFGLGIAVGPLLAGILSVVFFELPFLVDGFLCLVGAAIVYRYMTETVTREEGK